MLKEIAKSGQLFLIPATIQDKLIIRFTVTSQFTTKDDILRDWNLIREAANLVLSQHCTSQPSPRAKNLIPPPVTRGSRDLSGGLFLESVNEGGDDQAQAGKIIKQPGASLVRREGSCDLEMMLDPLDDCFSEEAPDTTKHKLSSFLFSYLSVQSKKKTMRSLSCNSVPMSAQKSLPSDASVKNGGSFRARIFSGFPEEMMMMKKGAFKKLIKFYSVPSFPECSSQCALQLPCCPLQAMV